jgi:hypothetical protein
VGWALAQALARPDSVYPIFVALWQAFCQLLDPAPLARKPFQHPANLFLQFALDQLKLQPLQLPLARDPLNHHCPFLIPRNP